MISRAEWEAQGHDNWDDPGYRRECRWPGCDRWWHALDGPYERGWVWAHTPGRALMCPEHVATGHLPDFAVEDDDKFAVTFKCGCGASRFYRNGRGVELMAWWRDHVQQATELAAACPDS